MVDFMSEKKCFESIKQFVSDNFVPVIGSISSFVMLLLYFFLEKKRFIIDYYSLILFFSIFLFPASNYLEKIKIGSLELSRRQEAIEKRTLLGEVVTADWSKFYYIYKSDDIYEIPDKETADFFSSNKGIIKVEDNDIDNSLIVGKIDSVNSGTLYKVGGHIFILLSNKLKHVGTAAFLVKWRKSSEQPEEMDEEKAINNYGFWDK